MYTYSQSTGVLSRDGTHVITGYAGHGEGVNDPDMQGLKDVGPIPQGRYTMTGFVDEVPGTGLGTIVLKPDPANEMFGRGEFRIHGDNGKGDQSASDGCIIAGHAADRQAIWDSNDRILEVVA
ncbi:MAG TPA: tlde1 domain-containing protein [Bryobacteraceae bacterium]|jgi:hypothetical protein|nr:tlde1 domain-containing protein [Bryobacteraceae bacterium]